MVSETTDGRYISIVLKPHAEMKVVRRLGSQVARRTIGDPATQSVSDARALLRTDDLPASAAARAVPLFCRLAMEAACARGELCFPGLQIVTPRALIKEEWE